MNLLPLVFSVNDGTYSLASLLTAATAGGAKCVSCCTWGSRAVLVASKDILCGLWGQRGALLPNATLLGGSFFSPEVRGE